MMNAAGTNGDGSGRPLGGDETMELSAQLAGLAKAGLPLSTSLASMAEELPRGRLRRAMAELARGLEAGRPLEEAIADPRTHVPAPLRGLVVAGVRTGQLGEVLGDFSQYASAGVELRRRLRLSLAYPTLSLLITVAVFAFVAAVVVPQFEVIFRDFGIALPGVTVALIELGNRTASMWQTFMSLAVVALVVVAGANLLLPTATVRALAAQLPVIGGVWRWSALSEFCHWLALLLEHRLPLPEALRLAGDGVEDARLRAAAREMAEHVEEGRTLAQAMAASRPFPPRLPRLLSWSEKRGTLPEVLHMVGEMFAARASAHTGFAGAVLSVLCFLMILFGVALVFLGLMLPMITLISRLSG
jgi:general secretion pathway protein F